MLKLHYLALLPSEGQGLLLTLFDMPDREKLIEWASIHLSYEIEPDHWCFRLMLDFIPDGWDGSTIETLYGTLECSTDLIALKAKW